MPQVDWTYAPDKRSQRLSAHQPGSSAGTASPSSLSIRREHDQAHALQGVIGADRPARLMEILIQVIKFRDEAERVVVGAVIH